jgi:hypothetical protein
MVEIISDKTLKLVVKVLGERAMLTLKGIKAKMTKQRNNL